MANEQPTNKTKAKSAFLKQANHFARLGTATDQDVAALIDSMSAMLASVLKKPISIQIQDVDTGPNCLVLNPTAEQCDQLKKVFDDRLDCGFPRTLVNFVESAHQYKENIPHYAIAPTATPSETDIHIDLMGLNVRAMHALKSAGLVYASHIATLTETQLSEIRGLGKKTVPSIIEALRVQGLTLAGEA